MPLLDVKRLPCYCCHPVFPLAIFRPPCLSLDDPDDDDELPLTKRWCGEKASARTQHTRSALTAAVPGEERSGAAEPCAASASQLMELTAAVPGEDRGGAAEPCAASVPQLMAITAAVTGVTAVDPEGQLSEPCAQEVLAAEWDGGCSTPEPQFTDMRLLDPHDTSLNSLQLSTSGCSLCCHCWTIWR